MRAANQFLIFLSIFLPLIVSASSPRAGYIFVENQGQWHSDILFRASIEGGSMLITKNGFEYHFSAPTSHFMSQNEQLRRVSPDRVQMSFGQAAKLGQAQKLHQVEETFNFFIGKDSKNWRAHVKGYRELRFANIKTGQDLRIYSHGASVKYEIILHPGAKVSDVELLFDKNHAIQKANGSLSIKTSTGLIKEYPPFTYQTNENGRSKVSSSYVIDENKVRFEIGDYDRNKELVIDPELVFSTLSGSVSDNWSQTATYDAFGNLYAGGVVFGSVFPITPEAYQSIPLGAAQSDSTGSVTEVVIQKYSSDGSSLLYSTFLGGNGSEVPHSLICNSKNELVIFGTTSSSDFPITARGYDNTFEGGPDLRRPVITTGINFVAGTDIFVAVLSEDGTELKGSTYLGGNSTDGIHNNDALQIKNYGDEFRGEVFVDKQDRVYIASTTNSTDFPVVNGDGAGRSNDAIICRLNPYLTRLEWSTHLSGRFYDAAYGIRVDDDNAVYVVGSTISSDLGATNGALEENRIGEMDAFVAKFVNDEKVALTFLGTQEEDLGMFLDLDSESNVYVFGLTFGDYPITNGVYRIAESGQYIHCLDKDLRNTVFSTVFGTGRGVGVVDLVPTAFLVNSCGNIYIAGWGGKISAENGYNENSTTIGLPVSNDAYRKETTGNNFYFAILESGARSFLYGTFFGSEDPPNPADARGDHLDGGTCRFDKNGIIYHSACVCRAQDFGQTVIFPTENAYNSRHRSSNCNMAAFKFDVSSIKADFDIIEGDKVNPEFVCASALVDLKNKSVGALTYEWSIDGEPVTRLEDFEYRFVEDRPYKLGLKAFNQLNCAASDSTVREVRVRPFPTSISRDTTVCSGAAVQLEATGGNQYAWEPAQLVDNPTGSIVTTSVNETTVFEVSISDSICTASRLVEIEVNNDKDDFFVTPDAEICLGDEVILEAFGKALSYTWIDENGSETVSKTLTVNPSKTTTFTAKGIYDDGCVPSQSVTLTIEEGYMPSFGLDFDYKCGEPTDLIFSLEPNDLVESYTWYFGDGDSLVGVSPPPYRYGRGGDYEVQVKAKNRLGCELIASQRFSIPEDDGIIPNAFSPNGDGINERFVIGTAGSHLKIYNRWGKLIVNQEGYKNDWGENVSPDVYFYEIELPNRQVCKGWVEVFN